jgi:predicted membrane protein
MKEAIRYIIGILEILPFWSVTAIVAMFSALVTFGVIRGPLLKFKWIFTLTLPFPIAYSIYWAPVWLGANVSEYAVWAPLFIIPWYVASVALSVLLLQLSGKLKRSKK